MTLRRWRRHLHLRAALTALAAAGSCTRRRQAASPAGDRRANGVVVITIKKVYGPDVNLAVPEDELNNPKFTGCIDRNA